MTKLSYAWVRNTPLFKSVSKGLTFEQRHIVAVLFMHCLLSGKSTKADMDKDVSEHSSFMLEMALKAKNARWQ